MKFLVFLGLLISNSSYSKPTRCQKLREMKKKCLRADNIGHVNITCGGHWYRYWTDEYEMKLSKGETDFSDKIKPGLCIKVKYETMTMSCDEFIDYKVPLFFCRKQKKRICRRLKEDGFGSVTPIVEKRMKSRVIKPCSEVKQSKY